MISKRIWFSTTAVAVLLASTTVSAAPATRWRIDTGAGALAAGNDVSFTDHGVRRTADTEVGPALRLGAGYRLTDRFDLNASAQVASTDAALYGRDIGYTALTGGTRCYPWGRDLRVRPWLLGEAGWYRAESRVQLFGASYTERTANGAGFNLGSGFDVPLGRFISLGFDARWNQTVGVFDNPGFLTTTANLGVHFGS
jgi:Outer membrane protein beta-barrel domain